MGFFWSGRNASIERIFKRSARYWITTAVSNSLYAMRRQSAARDEAEERRRRGLLPPYRVFLAEQIGLAAGREGLQKGWTHDEAVRVAKWRVACAFDRIEARWEREEAGQRRSRSGTPAAVHHSGGLRDGAAANWARQRYS